MKERYRECRDRLIDCTKKIVEKRNRLWYNTGYGKNAAAIIYRRVQI